MPFTPDQQQEKNNDLLSKFANVGKEALSRVLNLPSQIQGGVLKATREVNEGTYQAPDFGTYKMPTMQGQKEFKTGGLIAPQLVGAFRGVKEKSSVMEELPKTLNIDPESGKGFAVGLAGEVLTPDIADVAIAGKVGNKLLSKFGGGVKRVGEQIAEAGIKPTKTQRESFFQAAKKTIGKYVSDNKLAGDLAENLSTKLDSLQNEFDDIAIKSGKKANKESIQLAIEESISSLNKVIDKGEIKALEEFRDELTSLGDEIDIADLTAMRKRLDEKIPKSQWQRLQAGEPVSKMVEQRMALQRIIQNISGDVISPSGKSLKELGRELMPLYKLKDIVGLQEGVSVAGRIGGLGDIAAVTGGFATGNTLEERLKNALLFGAGRRIISNPRVLSETARATIKAGEKIQQPGILQKGLLTTGKEAILAPFKPKTQEEQWTTPGFIPD